MQQIDLVFVLILLVNREEPRPCRSYVFAVPWGTTIAPRGCRAVSAMSPRIWVKFFLILCVCQQLLSGSCRSVRLTLIYSKAQSNSNTLLYISCLKKNKHIPSVHFKILISVYEGIMVITNSRLKGGRRL